MKLKKSHNLSLDEFINFSLYDKKFGYYMKKNPFGKKGDYITSPLVSNLFGEMIAIWCVAFWEHLGKPNKILIAEIGPGDATLCKDLLNAFKNFKEFYNCVEINLIEKSNILKKIQKNKIKSKKVKWLNRINEINNGPIIFLCNEFFDALPIKQLYKKNNLFLEKHIALEKNKKQIKFLFKKPKKGLVRNIKKLKLISGGNVIEYPIEAINYLNIISKKINKHNGALLTFDYGYTEKKNYNTLQSIKKHKYINILDEPGNSDITHHVNYKLFLEVLKKNNLEVQKIITQSEFLQKLGIIERANILLKKKNFKEKSDMFYRLKRLLHYKEMGSLFKVLLAEKKGTKFSLGF